MKQGEKVEQRTKRSGTEKRRTTKLVAFRVTPAEAESLRVAAEEAGQSIAAYVRGRALAVSKIVPRRGKASIDDKRLSLALSDLGRVGGNLNQLTRAANSGREVPREEALAAFEAVQRLRAEIRAAMGLVGRAR